MNKLLLFLFSMSCLICNSQNYQQDSIIKSINSSNNEIENALSYSRLAKLYKQTNLDSAIYCSKIGKKLSNELSYNLGIAENSANLGDYYVKQNNLDLAKANYSIAVEKFQEEGEIFKYTQNSMRLGNINLAQNRHIEALKLYQDCLEVSKTNNFNTIIPHLYNNLGILYLQIGDYDDARTNLDEAYKLFQENNDENSSVSTLSNISLIQSNLGNYDEAINGYLDVSLFHLKTEKWLNLAFIYNAISEIYSKKEDYKRAQEYLEMALNTMKNKGNSNNSGPSSLYNSWIFTNAAQLYYTQRSNVQAKEFAYKALNLSFKNSYKESIFKNAKILASIFDNEKQKDSALAYYKIYVEHKDQYQEEYDIKQLTQLKMQNEFDEILKRNEIEQISKEAAYKEKELKYLSVSIVTLLSAIILILLYFNQKNKTAKLILRKENLELEKRELHQDLDYKKKELASNMMYLMEKNEFITSISKKLKELKPDVKKDNKELIQKIINEIKQNSATKIWDEFELRFKEVHERFYHELNKTYPDLTPNEIKICVFLKLNMSTKEISAITHQSIKSINMARFRLRKKINIESDENLITFLNSL